MTPFGLTTDQQQQIRMAQRSQLRLAQAFQLFMVQIAHGTKPTEAVEKIDEAMDVWADYQDAHTIEMPDGSADPISAMMNQFRSMMEQIGERKAERESEGGEIDAEFASPEELCRMEQTAWDEYREAKAALETLHDSTSPEAKLLEQNVVALERHWRGFGTAHLRLQLAQLTPAARTTPGTPQLQDGPKA